MTVVPRHLKQLWFHCQNGGAVGIPEPKSDEEFSDQIGLKRLGLAFRHDGNLRPCGAPPRVLHTDAVVGLVWWLPAVNSPIASGVLSQPQLALARLSNTPEPDLLDPHELKDNDYLIGAALKFEPTEQDGTSRNLLFVSTPKGLPRPQLLDGDDVLQTRVDSLGAMCSIIPRCVAERLFQIAVADLERLGFPSPVDHLMLPLTPFGEQRLQWLSLRPRTIRPIKAAEDFKPVLMELAPGTHLYDVIGFEAADDPGRVVAHITIADGFRVSDWASANLFFGHPGHIKRPTEPHPNAHETHRFEVEVDRAALEAIKKKEPIPHTIEPRVEIVSWLADELSYGEVARLSGYTVAAVRAVADLYDEGGPPGLRRADVPAVLMESEQHPSL